MLSAIATRSSNTFTCTLPIIPSPLFGSWEENITTILSFGGNAIASPVGTITVYDCTSLSTCSSCLLLNPGFACGWCVSFGSCTQSNQCATPTVTNKWLTSSCPVITTSSPLTVPEGYSQSTTVTVNNTLDLDSLGPASGVYVCNFAFQGTTSQVNSTPSFSSTPVNVTYTARSFAVGSLAYGADVHASVGVLSPQVNLWKNCIK